ncbi:MAG TPA: DinB family protein [Actinomycetota bacterium]|nr:DinB family protein [Actinomycetota bacterium]
MPKPLPPVDELLDLLRTHPVRLAELTDGLPERRLRTPPARDEWSAVEILAHLRSCSDMWGRAIEEILAGDHPTIRAINPRTWVEETDYREQAFAPSFHSFTRQRTELLRTLDSLASEDWERAATVTGAGKPLELTVHRYADRLAIHERAHVTQIARIVGAPTRPA